MVINTNIRAIEAHRDTKVQDVNLRRAQERLSSGVKLNHAADDAAGIAIASKMTAQARGLDRAEMNIGEGTDLLTVADGVCSIIADKINRIRELAIYAANDTNTDDDRATIQLEVQSLLDGTDDAANNYYYNAVPVASPGPNPIPDPDYYKYNPNFDPANAADFYRENSIYLRNADGKLIDEGGNLLGPNDKKVLNPNYKPSPEGEALEKMILYLQIGANAEQGMFVLLEDCRTEKLFPDPHPQAGVLPGLPDVSGPGYMKATLAIAQCDFALNIVNAARARYGAYMDRLEKSAQADAVTSLNLKAAISRIYDADMAKELMNQSKSTFMMNASISMIAQADQAAQRVVSLVSF